MRINDLTKAQQRLWIEWKLFPESPAYNNPLCYKLSGNLNISFLESSIQKTIAKNTALRSHFIEQGGFPKQVISERHNFFLSVHDYSMLNGESLSHRIDAFVNEVVCCPFDLSQAPLYRFELIKINENEYIFIINIHHIVSDGTSATILLDDLSQFYQGLIDSSKVIPEDTDDNYRLIFNQRAVNKDSLAYWKTELLDHNLTIDLFRQRTQKTESYRGCRYRFSITSEQTKTLKKIARKLRTTEFNILLSVYLVTLSLYTDQDDITITFPVDMRSREEKSLFGFFVNNIPFNTTINMEENFLDLIKKINLKRKTLKPHQQIDLLDIINLVKNETGALGDLFNVSFVRANFALMGLHFFEVKVDPVPVYTGAVKDDLCLYYDDQGLFVFEFEYRKSFYSHDYVKSLERCYTHLLESLCKREDSIMDVVISDLLEINNNTAWIDGPSCDNNNVTLFEKVEKYAKLTPNKTAIYTENTEVTYQEFYNTVQFYIHFLKKNISDYDLPIIICLQRSSNMVALMLACQCIHLAYVPTDVSTPCDRLNVIAEDSRAQFILVDSSSNVGKLDKILQIPAPAGNKKYNFYPVNNPNAISYIIYTSGSTGTPKGVAISSLALNNFLHSMYKKPGCSDRDIWLAITTVAFDISILELFLPLFSGSSLYLANQNQYKDPVALKKILNHQAITIMQATPAMWQMLLDIGWHKKEYLKLLVGGEALSPSLAKQLLQNSDELWNMYGPTEATIWCSCKKISTAEKNISIGDPIENTTLAVCNKKLETLPIYAKGELCIAGAGLSMGYVNRPALTESSFVNIQYDNKSVRLYKTGDVAIMLPDGEVCVFGRKDNQVKLHGYRIELGEIENQLLSQNTISMACVIVHKDQLIAFLVLTKPDQPFSMPDCLSALALVLPDYMLPKKLIVLDTMPLSPSGKINRKALPLGKVAKYSAPVPATTSTEKRLLSIWQSVFNRNIISIDETFFYYGGHSLLAIQIIHQIYADFDVTITLGDFMSGPTIQNLATKIDTLICESKVDKESVSSNEIAAFKDGVPLSFAQERMWFLLQLEGDRGQFNMAAKLSIKGCLNIEGLKTAILRLFEKHPMLCSQIKMINNEPKQYLLNASSSLTDCFEIDNNISEERLGLWAGQAFVNHNKPLIKFLFGAKSSSEAVLAICISHLLIDGYSVVLLFNQLWSFYQETLANTLTAHEVNEVPEYYQYIMWERSQVLEKRKMQYWQDQLTDCPYLDFSNDFQSSDFLSGEYVTRTIQPEVLKHIKKICRDERLSISSIFVASFALLLNEITEQNDFCIGLPFANREYAGSANMVGPFMNLLPLRIIFPEEISFLDWLHCLEKSIHQNIKNGDIPFAKIVELLNVPRVMHKTPIFNAIINIQLDPFSNPINVSGLQISAEPLHNGASKYLLTFDIYYSEDGVKIYCEYAKNVFNEVKIQEYLDQYEAIISHYIKNIRSLISAKRTAISKSDLADFSLKSNNNRTLPSTDYQVKMLEIWRALLGVDEIFLEDNFFELGGNSLLATKLILICNESLHKDVPLYYVFNYPDLLDFSVAVDQLAHITPKLALSDAFDTPIYLTPNQDNIRLIDQNQEVSQYCIGVMLHDIDESLLDDIISRFNDVIAEHDIYRLYLDQDEGVPLFSNSISLKVLRLNSYSELKNINIDLTQAPLMKLIWCANEDMLIVYMHHLIGDEWSMSLMLKEVFSGNQKRKKPLYQWRDYLNQRANYISSLEYWSAYCGNNTMSRLMYTKSYHVDKKAAYSEFIISESDVNLAKGYARKYKTSLQVLFLAIFSWQLLKYCLDDNLMFVNTYSRRDRALTENLHGYLVNLCPVVVSREPVVDFETLLLKLNKEHVSHLKHTQVDFSEIQKTCHLMNPAIVFNYQSAFKLLDVGGKAIKWEAINTDQAKFPFVFHCRETCEGALTMVIEYQDSLYHKAYVDSFLTTFQQKLSQLVTLGQPKYKLLQPVSNHDKSINISEQFSFAKLLPAINLQNTSIAMRCGEELIDYQTVFDRVRKLASIIASKVNGSLKGKVIAVEMNNGIDYIISILAIMYVGGVFIPIDVQTPQLRKRYIISDSAAIALISKIENQDYDIPVWNYSMLVETSRNVSVVISPALYENLDPCYIIYTSGTTGKPKGVVITYSGFANFLKSMQDILNLTSHDRILQFASIGFDASIWEIFLSLSVGAILFIPINKQRYAGKSLQDYIVLHGITHMILTPSVLATLDSKKLTSLRSVASGGEACSSKLVSTWSNRVKFINAYGPTEAAVCVATHTFSSEDKATIIGSPLNQVKFLVADDNSSEVDPGAIGELLVAGPNVAQGYLHHENLNKEKFVQLLGERFYCTGDLVRYIANVGYEYIARKDSQVKINGVRIELDEISNILESHPEINKATCLVSSEKIIAYYESSHVLSKQTLFSYVFKQLPRNFCPNDFVHVNHMPVTISGKIDVASLPKKFFQKEKECVTSRSPLEERLKTIWKKYLSLEKINSQENFFALGGQSLQAMQVCSDISVTWELDITLETFYECGNIQTLAQAIEMRLNVEKQSLDEMRALLETLSFVEKQQLYMQLKAAC